MKIIRTIAEMMSAQPSVATVGFFDGVHRGHRFLIDRVKDEAKLRGLSSMVITFDKHPREVLHSEYVPQLLSTLDDKLAMISSLGVDQVVVLPFDTEMASLSAQAFMQEILHKQLQVRCLVIGYDNRFGHDRDKTFDDYQRYGAELNMEVIHNQAYMLNGVQVSSSIIRSFLMAGEVDMAALCLGYVYRVKGVVVHGFAEGRKMGFPTANIDTKAMGLLVPAHGVYAVTVKIEGLEKGYQGMMNIGVRPTFDGTKESLEVNILHFADDIYGKFVEVGFVSRVRSERKFSSVVKLKEQLEEDYKAVEALFQTGKEDEKA